MALIPLILKFYEAVGDVCSVSYQETNKTLFRKATWMATSVFGINEQLLICCEELKKGVIAEPFCGDIWKVQSQHRHPKNSDLKKTLLEFGDTALDSLGTDFYFHNSKILYFKDFVPVIEDGMAQMNHLLDDAQEMMSRLSPDAYGDFYLRKKSEFDDTPVRIAYNQWKSDEGPFTFEKLKAKQIETLANTIKTGIMKHDTKPIHKENNSVDMDIFIQYLSDDYEFPEPFKKCCAKFFRYALWRDDILQIHYNDFGRYFCRSMHKFSQEQLTAIYELGTMLSLIHQDMVKLRPELAPYLNQKEDTNTFGIVNSMTRLMQQTWFKDFRTDKKYDNAWIEKFLDDLMKSEWGHVILQEWKNARRRPKLKCKIIGAMKDAGVLKSDYQTIAEKIDMGNELPAETHANYMGYGKAQPYFEWICDNVKG